MEAKSKSVNISPYTNLAELGKVTNVGDVELVVATTWRTTKSTAAEATAASWHAHTTAKSAASTHTTAATAHHWSRLRKARFCLTILRESNM